MGMTMKRDSVDIFRCALVVAFVLIMFYLLGLCMFSLYIAEALLARTLPLSITLVAIAILFFAIEYRAKK